MILITWTLFCPWGLTNAKSLAMFIHDATIAVISSLQKVPQDL